MLTNDSQDPVQINVIGTTGQLYRSVRFSKPEPSLSARISLTGMAYGVCLLDIRQGKSRVVRKIIHVQ
ncbi:hypothetical protein [Spirosoma rhododendri]|uniref:T9SS type A sorting domain-containing protein n=1 Tax=Spirosoma rhododendri TaxID=2728024 RepID=A0A7L5DPZ4_9BACT|nr:hypothetical protein [Spirosoma rhododendri]QJD79273.1 hypothetical protein HH216_13275 [Spirosoma rhododendri]